jgi:cell wall-associated NlpC family hydrolase
MKKILNPAALLLAACLLLARTPLAAQDSVSWTSLEERYQSVLGQTYRSGGINPGGFDCSGLQKYLFKAYGYTMPASSSSYAHWGRSIERDSIKPGDFLLFAGRSAGSIGHVGLCVGRAEGKILMLHSATHSGVLIENWVGQSYYERRYAGARRGIAFRFEDEALEASGPIAAQDPKKAL